jgi:hypothetical protein
MKTHWKPILTLALFSATLAEVVSGNTPLLGFIQPITFIIFVTVGYGFPVLIIRDIVVRKGWGIIQLFFLGVGYGIYNEGLFSRTIFYPFNVPSMSFDTYGLVGGVRIPWLLAIGSWHALFAIIFPIVFVHFLFPSSAEKPWLNTKFAWLLALVSVGLGVFDFFSRNGFPEPGGNGHFLFMIFCWIALWLVVIKLPRVPRIVSRQPALFSWRAPFIGFGLFITLYLMPVLLAVVRAPSLVFVAYVAAVIIFIGYRLSKVREVPLMYMLAAALGGEIGVGLFALLFALFSGPIQLVTIILSLVMFVWALGMLKSKIRSAKLAR